MIGIEIGTEGVIGTEIMTKEIEMIEGDETDHQEGAIDLGHPIAVIGIEIVHQIGKVIWYSCSCEVPSITFQWKGIRAMR